MCNERSLDKYPRKAVSMQTIVLDAPSAKSLVIHDDTKSTSLMVVSCAASCALHLTSAE
jgi:hypothetical protein